MHHALCHTLEPTSALGQKPGTFQTSLLQVGIEAKKIKGSKGTKASIYFPFRKSPYGVPRWLSGDHRHTAGLMRKVSECRPMSCLPRASESGVNARHSRLSGREAYCESCCVLGTHVYAGCPNPLAPTLIAPLGWSSPSSPACLGPGRQLSPGN